MVQALRSTLKPPWRFHHGFVFSLGMTRKSRPPAKAWSVHFPISVHLSSEMGRGGSEEGKMQSGDANETGARTDSLRGTPKPKLSPELQELMHLLSSLEHRLIRDGADQ